MKLAAIASLAALALVASALGCDPAAWGLLAAALFAVTLDFAA